GREGWLYPTAIATAARGDTIVLADPVGVRPEPARDDGADATARLAAAVHRLRLSPHVGDGRRGALRRAAVTAALGLEDVRGRWRDAWESAWSRFTWRTLVPL